MTEPSPGRVIFRRYLLVFLAVVGGAVLVSNGLGIYLTYRGTQSRLNRLQRERVAQAQATALTPLVQLMEQALREDRSALRSDDAPGIGRPTLRQREAGYVAETRNISSSYFAQISYIAPSGRELARVAGNHIRRPRRVSFAGDPVVQAARAHGIALGSAYAVHGSVGAFVPGGAPSSSRSSADIQSQHRGQRILRASMAVTEGRAAGGVLLAQVNLYAVSLLLGTSSDTSPRSVYYVVDGRGQLVARSDAPDDVSLRDASALPEVRTALSEGEGPRPSDQQAVRGRDAAGRAVLATSAPLPLWGWYLIALRPDPGSQGPLTSAIVRIGISLVVFLVLAGLASLVLARRMTGPIRAIQAGATRIGDGHLEERIEIRTGDELEVLAEEFNHMAARLGESYATLEQRVEDRTRDLLEALDELERVSGEKTRFLANMSHELRTPLNAIINFADVLRDASAGSLTARQFAYADDIHAAGRHLLELIIDILDLAKIEAGRIDLDTEAVEVEECLRDGLRVVRERAKSKGLSMSLEVDPDVGAIEADRRKLRQDVFNLLANAVRFTPSDGSVGVRARREGERVEIAVTDTGIGIDPADHERIFKEFEQAGPTDDRREGTGLGLALARRLVELHGGRILLESAPGAGSTFTVVLPRSQGPTGNGVTPAPTTAAGS